MAELYQSLSHSRWNCKYPVVVVPKRRRHKWYGEMRRQRGPIFHEWAGPKACRIMEGPVRTDPLQMGLDIPPTPSVATVIGFLKGKSAMAIARPCGGRDRHFSGEPFWARGDAVSTVGFELEPVRAYIRDPEAIDDQGQC